ncbi:DUF2905 domain-containing protein [Egicoccus sp. AB-alg2]|uniref:DUF2905 domain-containing protein n=1 Tax=Egicoccus sp. AB-alg2 TaxID=3242693 RepID=UPI00359D018E
MSRGVGPVLVVAGLGVVVLGLLVWTGALGWFGRLPGDVRYQSGTTRVFVPITSMLLASVVLTVVVNVILRLLR